MRRNRAGPRVLVLLALLGVLATGCAELTATELRQIERSGTSLRPLLDPDSLAIPGTDTDDVIEALGDPYETDETSPPQDQRPGTVITMRYEGLEVVVRELREPTREFISDITITSSEYATSLPFRVGASRGEIEEVLGEPAEARDDAESSENTGSPTGTEAVYALTDDGDRCIVTYEGDRASRMRFTFS
ncbi:MAG TPA: hypothetical protein VK923_16715 [Euzebyales bacterium]|nr:hypothetical protein [Euzebyales bacterium]